MDFQGLMEEPPGGVNHGRAAKVIDVSQDEVSDMRTYDLGQLSRQDFLYGEGWGLERGTAHRGVLQDDEHVDLEELQHRVEEGLGFTYEQIHSVYRQGLLSSDQRRLRAQIDARLLALSRSGGLMLSLARLLGWDVDSNGKGDSCRTMERALARARVQEASSEGAS